MESHNQERLELILSHQEKYYEQLITELSRERCENTLQTVKKNDRIKLVEKRYNFE